MVLHLEDPLKAPAVVEVEGEFDPGAELFADQPEALAIGAMRRVTRGPSAFARFGLWVFGLLFALVLAVQAWRFVTGLWAATPWLGYLALGLLMLALGVVAVQAVREAMAGHTQAEVWVYPGSMHGFNCWARASYHAPSAALAHGRSLAFLAQALF